MIIIIIIACQAAHTITVKYRVSAKDLVTCDRQSVGAPSEQNRALGGAAHTGLFLYIRALLPLPLFRFVVLVT
jgi:hypothetical protein